MLYQRIKPSTGEKVGDPADLPLQLAPLSAATLADLPKALDPCPEAWVDTGFVPAPTAPPEPALNFVDDVPTFQMRFTPGERIAIRASQDALVVDFQRLLDDPRVTHVDRARDQVKGAILYLAGELPGLDGKTTLTPPILTDARAQAILAGDPA